MSVTPRVLLVSDESPLVELLSNRVPRGTFEMKTVACPREALAVAEKSDIDIVVLNLKEMMAEGVLFLRSLRQSRPLIEVITLSIPSAMRLSIEGMKLGVFADLQMPLDLDDLTGKIKEAWERKKARSGGLSLRRRLESLAAAVSFAEAGAFDASRGILAEGTDAGPNQEEE
ncbi:MAG: response regulator [Pseudomonadota bacterium]